MIEKIIDKPQSKATSMATKSTSGTANWAGSKYNFTIRRAADTSLEDVDNHDSLFHDNRIELTITRTDGSLTMYSPVWTSGVTSTRWEVVCTRVW